MKKIALIMVHLVLLASMVVAGYYLFQVLQERQLADFIAQKQLEFLPKDTYDKQEGNIGDTHVLVYYPKDGAGQRIKPTEDLIHRNLRQSLGDKKPSGKIKELLFISTADRQTNFQSVHKREITPHYYRVEGFKISKNPKSSSQTILLTADNQLFTLEHLFSDKEKAKSLLSAQLQRDLEAKQIPAQEVVTAVEAFEQLDLRELTFVYEEGRLRLDLPEKEVGTSSLTVDVAQFFDCIQSQYLAVEDAQAYEAYQAEKARKAQEKMLALTFDDGPSSATTPQVLAILKKYNVKATFFLLGQNIEGKEDILQAMLADGHEIANHSWSHPKLSQLSAEQVKQEIESTQTAIERVIGKRPTIMRPPYGSVNQLVLDTMKLPVMYWSVDSLDWKSRNPQAIVEAVKVNTYPGAIILMHDIHQPTVDSLEPTLQYLQSQGYVFGTLTEMLGENLNPQEIYYDRTTARPLE